MRLLMDGNDNKTQEEYDEENEHGRNMKKLKRGFVLKSILKDVMLWTEPNQSSAYIRSCSNVQFCLPYNFLSFILSQGLSILHRVIQNQMITARYQMLYCPTNALKYIKSLNCSNQLKL